MFNSLLLVLSFLSCLLGFAAIALSQKRHWCHVMQQTSAPGHYTKRALRYAGAFFLGMGMLIAFVRDGFAFGTVLWTLELSLAAICVAFLIRHRAFSNR